MQQPDGRAVVAGAKALLLAGDIILQVVATAIFASVESESCFHAVIRSDELKQLISTRLARSGLVTRG